MRHWREHSGTPDLKCYILDQCGYLFGRKFERDAETRRFAGIPKRFLIFSLVHLNDNAVSLIIFFRHFFLPLFPIRNYSGNIANMLVMNIDFKTQRLEK